MIAMMADSVRPGLALIHHVSRYKTPVGEIDLVAIKGRRLAFIEVKRRTTKDDAAWTIPAKQRRRIVRAA